MKGWYLYSRNVASLETWTWRTLHLVWRAGFLGLGLGVGVVVISGIFMLVADKLTGGNGTAGVAAATTGLEPCYTAEGRGDLCGLFPDRECLLRNR